MTELPEGFVAASPLGPSAVLLVHRDGTRLIASLDAAGTLWLDRSRPGEPTRRAVHERAADEPRAHAAGGGPGAAAAAAAAEGWVLSPTSGILRSVAVAAGDRVAAGVVLGVVEAMKMQIELRAPCEGTVESGGAVVGARVERGARVMRVANPDPSR